MCCFVVVFVVGVLDDILFLLQFFLFFCTYIYGRLFGLSVFVSFGLFICVMFDCIYSLFDCISVRLLSLFAFFCILLLLLL